MTDPTVPEWMQDHMDRVASRLTELLNWETQRNDLRVEWTVRQTAGELTTQGDSPPPPHETTQNQDQSMANPRAETT